MNSLYFFLPFILIASVGIYQDTFAIESYRGFDYLDIKNPDGTHTQTLGLPPWIETGQLDSQGRKIYTPFIFTDGSSKTVETGFGSVKLNPDGSYSFYKKGRITETELFKDTILAKYADVSNLNSWTYPNSVNNDTPDIFWNGNTLTSTKSAAIGVLEYKFVFTEGKWKTQLEATNLSALTTKAFGFDQIIDLNRDTISFGGITRNLDNFNNTTFDKQWITNNKAKVINFLNDVHFDFDIDFQYLNSITVIDTGPSKSRLIFDYRTSTPLLPNETLIIDPTYSQTAAYIVDVEDENNSDTCNLGSTKYITGLYAARIVASADTTDCARGAARFNTSTIDDSATIQSVTFKGDISAVTNPRNCDITDYGTTNPETDAAATVFTNIGAGTVLVNNNTYCTTTGNNKSVALGATAATNLEAQLNIDRYTIGFKADDETVDASTHSSSFDITGGATPYPTLEVVYIVGSPANPVTSITSANLSANSVDIIWTAPNDFGSGTFQNYTANYTTPWGQPLTFLGNTTSLFYNVTGLTFGTQYSFRVAALTEITPYNTTGSYILNITTTTNTYSLPPTDLTATSGLPTTINLRWDPATIDNILGYRIERETPIDTGWATLVSNTTNTITNYNDTSVTTNIKYNYRVTGMNGSGFSTVSNEDDSYAYHIPDAVTDLTGSSTDFSTIALEWTEPTLYADLIGYRINYTTPEGNPTTIILPNPYTTGMSATILDLIPGNNYSFRVAPVTIFGANASGNIFNATTGTFIEPGDLGSGDITNTDDFQIFFDRDDINSTAIQVDVTYSDTYDLSCDLAYQMARFNQTYSNLTETVVDADDVSSSFVFINATGDIINIRCWDTLTGDEAYYVLTITEFPFLEQIDNMRNGTYGTYFQIGAIDGVTLMVCILAMIGFNRTNPIAGIFFLVITVGVLSAFGIITYPIVMYPALALLFVWAFISTRKDD